MVPMFVIVFLITLFGGTATFNGQEISGALAALQMLPMLIILPFVIVFHAIFFGGFLTLGLWIYRLRKTNRDHSGLNKAE